MDQLKSVKTISAKLKDFLTASKLQSSATRVEELIEMLSRVYYTAEVSEKIINLNSNEAEIKDQIGVLL